MKTNVIYNKDCLLGMKELPDNSFDLLCTDPPYGISFMGKQWDRAIPAVALWKEALRVLKPGAFAFVMCIPRQDCLARMIVSLEDAGFNVSFTSMYHCFASGFPKASNIGKMVDKRLGAKRERIGTKYELLGHGKKAKGQLYHTDSDRKWIDDPNADCHYVSKPSTPAAKALDDSYGGFQPKPAVEVVIVAMKPLSEKTYVDQALKNRKGITWLDEGRIPYKDNDKPSGGFGGMDSGIGKPGEHQKYRGCNEPHNQGRFPANLLCSDDVLNDGRDYKTGNRRATGHLLYGGNSMLPSKTRDMSREYIGDSGSFSRYFSLDAWFDKKLKELDKLFSKAYNKEKNIGEMLWEISQVEESLGSKSNDLSVDGVTKNSPTTRVTEQENINSVRQDAMQSLDLQDQSQDAKSVAKKSSSTETDIVQRLAQIKRDTETLLQILESKATIHTTLKEQTLFSQSVANYVTGKLKDLRDIIQISIKQPRLFGSVIPAIIKQMQQDLSQDRLWQNFWQERIKLLSESQRRTFPFAIISKASKAEKNRGCEGLKEKNPFDRKCISKNFERMGSKSGIRGNIHSTVKPLKLMSYLITLGSQPGTLILDPFLGSGTTAISAKMLDRQYIGYEINKEYFEIAKARLKAVTTQLSLFKRG